jgi:hypothetical protein
MVKATGQDTQRYKIPDTRSKRSKLLEKCNHYGILDHSLFFSWSDKSVEEDENRVLY